MESKSNIRIDDLFERLKRRYKVAAKVSGMVTSVGDDSIVIKEDTGEKTEHLVSKNIPLAGGQFIGHGAQVEEGDWVKEGDLITRILLADGNDERLVGEPLDIPKRSWKGVGVSGDEMVFWQREDGNCRYAQARKLPIGDDIRSGTTNSSSLETNLQGVRSPTEHRANGSLVEVRTKEGTSVTLRRADGLLTMGADGRLRKIHPGEIVEGETLLPRAQPSVPYGTGPCTLPMRTTSGRGKQLDIDLDRDAGFLFGTYAADGSTCGNHHKMISIAARETEIRRRTAGIYEQWGLNTIPQDDYIATTSAALGGTLAEMCGTGAENKRVPDILWTAPPAFRDGFISGYFSGDGTVNGGEVTATTTSKKLAEGIVFALASRGVRASYRKYEQDEHQDQYMIKVYREGVANLPELALTRKQRGVEKIQNSEVKFSRDRMPVPEDLKTDVVRALRENDIAHSVYTTGYASRPRLRKIYGELPDRMQQIVDAPFWWDLVDSVEEAEAEPYVYDLDMGKYESFMVGGGLLAYSTSQEALFLGKLVEVISRRSQ